MPMRAIERPSPIERLRGHLVATRALVLLMHCLEHIAQLSVKVVICHRCLLVAFGSFFARGSEVGLCGGLVGVDSNLGELGL